ncbi:MAG: hypothetical protein GY906_23730 [bacterium]|nr:hypothetical protein [bacterium]
MTSHALNAYEKKAPAIKKWVWFEGATALKAGQALCYNSDYGTATVADGRRFSRVEVPSTTNARYFAGVVVEALAADTSRSTSKPALIEIYAPGSVCPILIAGNTVLGTGSLTFDVTATFKGVFRYEGLDGEGTADILQTVTYAADTAETCLAKLQEGPPSGGVEVVQLVDNTAFVMMVGGTSLLIGLAAGTGSPTEEILDGTIEGLRKKVEVITTAVTTNEAGIDIENNDGITLAGGALASVALGAIGDQVVFKWQGGVWRNMASVGGTES